MWLIPLALLKICFTEGENHNGKIMIKTDVKPSEKVRKCRISRNKKRHWKKGTKIEDAEDFLSKAKVDAGEGMSKIFINFE